MRIEFCPVTLCSVDGCQSLALCVPSRKRADFGDGEVVGGWGPPLGWTSSAKVGDVCTIVDKAHDTARSLAQAALG
jgi:hypothetical protein